MLYRLGMLNGRHFVSHQRETRVPLFKVTWDGEIIGMASVGGRSVLELDESNIRERVGRAHQSRNKLLPLA